MELFSSNAYSIFYTEIEKHLKRGQEIFLGQSVPSPEELREASTRFHTIKGGAGFFGLNAISTVSGELENILNREDLDLGQELPGIKRRILTLLELQTKLPLPVEEKK